MELPVDFVPFGKWKGEWIKLILKNLKNMKSVMIHTMVCLHLSVVSMLQYYRHLECKYNIIIVSRTISCKVRDNCFNILSSFLFWRSRRSLWLFYWSIIIRYIIIVIFLRGLITFFELYSAWPGTLFQRPGAVTTSLNPTWNVSWHKFLQYLFKT